MVWGVSRKPALPGCKQELSTSIPSARGESDSCGSSYDRAAKLFRFLHEKLGDDGGLETPVQTYNENSVCLFFQQRPRETRRVCSRNEELPQVTVFTTALGLMFKVRFSPHPPQRVAVSENSGALEQSPPALPENVSLELCIPFVVR